MGKINYIGFARQGNTFGPAQGNGEYTPILPPGHYKVAYQEWNDELNLTKFVPKMDEILNLGCKEYNEAVNVTARFLLPETAVAYAANGFLLKRSFLLYGPPGTGKSVLANKIADLAVEQKDAIAIYPTEFEALSRMLEVLDQTDKDRFKVIALEEFDSLISRRDEADWTTLLDGQFQSSNRLVLATTNNIEQLPQRLLRPGRFSSVVSIPALTPEGRLTFLNKKGLNAKLAASIVEKTDEFTIDDLKEVVQSVVLLGQDLDNAIKAIRGVKNLGKNDEE